MCKGMAEIYAEILNSVGIEAKSVGTTMKGQTQEVSENEAKHFYTREDVEKLKPDMQDYVKAMKKLKVNPCNCIAIEDSKRGIIAATSADIKAIRSCQYLNESKNEQNYITSIERISSTFLIIINNINSINKI